MKYIDKKGWRLNPDKKIVESITKLIQRNNGNCICDNKSHNPQCPCSDFTEKEICHCKLYIKDNNNL